jgi:hypothetical protein
MNQQLARGGGFIRCRSSGDCALETYFRFVTLIESGGDCTLVNSAGFCLADRVTKLKPVMAVVKRSQICGRLIDSKTCGSSENKRER